MANKKITELNEASSITSTDWLVMVDVANDETKKIHPDLVGASIPIQNTAPSGPEENDLWIDTSDDNRLKYFDGTSWEGVSDNVAGDTLPIGSIIPYGSSTAPTNWLVCDGSAVSRTTYSELFSAIGTSFGAGDGSTTFNLPNLKGKVAVGRDANDTNFDTIGETGGSKELQAHNHRVFASYGSGSSTVDAIRFQTGQAGGQYYDYGYGQNIFIESTGTGNSGNLQPYQVVCYIIKAKQSAGLVANVSNTYSTSQNDAYSCEYVNGIIESGSNTNGTYTKFADGTMICRGSKSGTTTWSDWWNFAKRTPDGNDVLNATFPQSFVDGNVNVSITTNYGSTLINANYLSISSSNFTFICFKPTNATDNNYAIQYIAIGRWK